MKTGGLPVLSAYGCPDPFTGSGVTPSGAVRSVYWVPRRCGLTTR